MSFADSLSTMDEGCERAILVGIQLKGDDASTLTSSLEELARLTDTAGAEVVATTYQKLDAPNPRTFVGSGKAEEIAEMCHAYAADIVIFDDELTPSQQSNLEKAVPKDVKVIDRTALILDIFALHATTKEGRLQVRLAQNQYLLPRLRGMWAHLASNRMGGGVGSRFGEGESQLEVDRRMVRKRITSIRRELEQVSRMRETAAKRALRIGCVQNCRSGLHECGQIEPDKPPCRRRRAFIRQAVRHARFNHAQARVARRPRGHAHRYRWLHPKASDDARRGVQEHARRNSGR